MFLNVFESPMLTIMEGLKHNFNYYFKTGNLILDTIISAFIISFFGYASANFYKVKEYLNNLFNNLIGSNTYDITFEGKEYSSLNYWQCRNDFPLTYLSIIHYIDRYTHSNFNKLKKIKEISSIESLDKITSVNTDDDNLDNKIKKTTDIMYKVDQSIAFDIAPNIKCICDSNSSNEKKNQEENSSNSVTIHTLTLKTAHQDGFSLLKKFINRCYDEYQKHLLDIAMRNQYYFIYVSSSEEDSRLIYDEYALKQKDMCNIKMLSEQQKDLQKRVDQFLNGRDWYEKKGLPWKLGIMLSGPPGTGKTTAIRWLLSYTKRNGLEIPLTRLKTCRELQNIFFKNRINGKIVNPENRIYIIEDIDAMIDLVKDRDDSEMDDTTCMLINQMTQTNAALLKQANMSNSNSSNSSTTSSNSNSLPVLVNNKKDNDKLTLSFILNILDGILQTPGRMLVITTNYPEKIDKAITRPGRIDKHYKFTKMMKGEIIERLSHFYDIDFNDEKCSNLYLKIDKIQEEKITTAEFMEICKMYKDNIEECLDYLITNY